MTKQQQITQILDSKDMHNVVETYCERHNINRMELRLRLSGATAKSVVIELGDIAEEIEDMVEGVIDELVQNEVLAKTVRPDGESVYRLTDIGKMISDTGGWKSSGQA